MRLIRGVSCVQEMENDIYDAGVVAAAVVCDWLTKLPADPWDNGGNVFWNISSGYPADVDGASGTIFYNFNNYQQY